MFSMPIMFCVNGGKLIMISGKMFRVGIWDSRGLLPICPVLPILGAFAIYTV